MQPNINNNYNRFVNGYYSSVVTNGQSPSVSVNYPQSTTAPIYQSNPINPTLVNPKISGGYTF